jgi:urate oxidase
MLGSNRYGKSGIRLVIVDRESGRLGSEASTRGPGRRAEPSGSLPATGAAAWHDLVDLTIDVTIEGDFAAAYVAGDNASVLPTDSMRGAVYALASEGPVGEPEAFGLRLAGHFLDTTPAATLARVALVADPWARIQVGPVPHPHAFTGGAGGRRTATVTRAGTGAWVVGGLTGLVVLKTAGSAFEGFLRDRFTTLEETRDRILATEVTARWRYAGTAVDWTASFQTARRSLLETFAAHDQSRSLQHTLYSMGEALLDACPQVDEVRMVMPNRHHLLVDLEPYGLTNDGSVFVATDRPFGVIEGEVVRPGASAPGRAWG